MKGFRNYFGAASFLLLVAATGSAWAATAANTQIVNTATLSFTGGSKDASVTVAVSLVAAPPTLNLTSNSGGYLGPDSPELGDSLMLTSNANGPATYTITAQMGTELLEVGKGSVNATAPSVSAPVGLTVDLGASVTTVGAFNTSGLNTLVIPAPDAAHVSGAGDTLTVNGLKKDDSITFGAYTRTITSVVKNADATYTITFDGAPLGAATGNAVPIYERQTVNGIAAKPGTIVTLGTVIHVFARATVTTPGPAATTLTATSNWADNSWTSAPASVNLIKYVRNLTTGASNPADATGTSLSVRGVSNYYHTSGVTAAAEDVLEYVLFATNTSNDNDLANTALSDVLPTSYVSIVTGAYGGGGADVFYSPNGSGALAGSSTLTIGAGNQAYTAITNPAATTLTVNVGTGAGPGAPGTIGKQVAGNPTNVLVAYRVKVRTN